MNKEAAYRSIYKYSSDQGLAECTDIIIKEECFSVHINDGYYKKICCTPSHLEELLIGDLVMQGLIAGSGDLKSIKIENDSIKLTLEPSSARPNDKANKGDICCPAEKLTWLMRQHLNSSELHKQTGGVHIMSLAEPEGILVSREDIGRHNAVDKLYGYCLLNGLDCSDKIFLSSGRISHEIIQKLVLMGIKLVVARAAVTSLAQDIAQEAGITVLGFVRGERFNLYTHPHRVIAPSSGEVVYDG